MIVTSHIVDDIGPAVRLLTCSNSGPSLSSAVDVSRNGPAAPGGLVPILIALLQDVGGRWIFTAPVEPGRETESQRDYTGSGFSWQALPIAEDLIERQREAISIRTLLWLFHYLHDTSIEPDFDHGIQSAWDAYRQVNGKFAGALAMAHENVKGEVVLIHDFHLMLAPSLFCAEVPDRVSRLAYFHHVPWCEPDYFGIIPEWMRNQLLESLLCCEVVGFHSARWGDAFLACCDRYLPDSRVAGRTVSYRDHETVVTTAPGPIDAAVLKNLSGEPATEQWREKLTDRAAGRRIITRVDRLDLWKNLVRGFSAFEALLRRRPDMAADVWFCAIVSRPRLQTDRHKRYQAMCEAAARHINDRFSTGHDVVSLIYPDGSENQRSRSVAAIEVASATLVNPTFDGLNMVAKEAAILNPRAPLLLSANAGVFPSLGSMAIPIQPFDVPSTADALDAAMTGSNTSRVAEIDACVSSLHEESAGAWLRMILGEPEPGIA